MLISDDGLALLMGMLKTSTIGNPLFTATLKIFAALLFKLPLQTKSSTITTIIDDGLLQLLCEAMLSDDAILHETVSTICVVISQTNKGNMYMLS